MHTKSATRIYTLLFTLLLGAGVLFYANPTQAGWLHSASAATLPTPVLIKDVNPGVNSGLLTQFDRVKMINLDGTIYFSGNTDAEGVELWKSNGTTAGTVLVKGIKPGVNSSWPTNFAAFNGKLFFVSDDGTNGKEVWSSDGSPGGTAMLKNINPGGSAEPYELVVSGGYLYFFADDGSHGSALWKSDGTASNTQMVSAVSGYRLTDVNGKVFFSVNGGSSIYYDWDLWKSDGTPGGTSLVKDFYWNQLIMVNVNGTLFLSAGDSVGSTAGELWKSDGTPGGTVLVKDINPAYGDASNPRNLLNVNGTLFFTADDGIYGEELWKSDGSENGTVLVQDINPGGGSFNYACTYGPCLADVNGTLIFTANDGSHGAELWKSDGSEDGAVLVKDISPSGSYIAEQITPVGGDKFFFVNGTDAGLLWVSDGTAAGTSLIHWFQHGPNLLTPVQSDGWLFFGAADGSEGKELWGLKFAETVWPFNVFLPLVRR